jgi:hypothetical protein
MELDGLIKVRRDPPLHESVYKADGKTVERRRSKRMTRGTKEQCILMELDALIKVRRDPPLHESFSKADSEIVERG